MCIYLQRSLTVLSSLERTSTDTHTNSGSCRSNRFIILEQTAIHISQDAFCLRVNSIKE